MTTKRVPDFGRATKKKTAKSGGGLQWKETPESRQRSAAVLLAAQHRPGGPAVQGGLSKSESRALRALARRRAPGRTNDHRHDQGLPSNLEASRMITPKRLATLRRRTGLLPAADPPSISGRRQKLQTRKARWSWRGGWNSIGMTKGFRRRGSGPSRSPSASRKSGATNSTGSRAISWTVYRRAISKRQTGHGRQGYGRFGTYPKAKTRHPALRDLQRAWCATAHRATVRPRRTRPNKGREVLDQRVIARASGRHWHTADGMLDRPDRIRLINIVGWLGDRSPLAAFKTASPSKISWHGHAKVISYLPFTIAFNEAPVFKFKSWGVPSPEVLTTTSLDNRARI
jgi:hypothetical protein